MKTCTRCLFDEATPNISFDENGMCSYCQTHDDLEAMYPTGNEVFSAPMWEIRDEIAAAGKGKEFDVIVGVSGGCDSSYMLDLVKNQLDLRPLAVHADNGWNGPEAKANMKSVTEALDVDLETVTVDPDEFHRLQRAFLLSGTPDIETPSDIALAAVLYGAAEKHGVQYTMDGHNFRTEGSWPLGMLYMDGRYIKDVSQQFGQWPLRTFPNMTMWDMFRWMVWRKIRRIRPLYYIKYDKEEAKQFLADRFGWKDYGAHHTESDYCKFYHSYFILKRYGYDTRINGFSALMRSGQLSRDEAKEKLAVPAPYTSEDFDAVAKKLGFRSMELYDLVHYQPRKRPWDFKTYKRAFELLRPVFWLLAKANLVPMTFYLKYTKRGEGR